MPVLIVSEKTWPQEGFSRNRSIRPSSSVTTMPNSSGFSTDLRPIVTAAPFSRWNSRSFVRSMSHSASPEITTNVSSSRSEARRTEPAVPSGDSSTEYSTLRPSQSPSPKYVRIACGRNATVTTISSKPWSRRSSRMCSMQGLPTIGTIGFGWFEVSGRRRVPSPPAITTAFTRRSRRVDSPADLVPRLAEVGGERGGREGEPRPEDPARPRRAGPRRHRQGEARVQEPGRDLPEQVHLEAVAAADRERGQDDQGGVAGGNREREPREAARVPEQHDREVNQQLVGERVGDLPERRLHPPAPGEEAVDLVGDRGRGEEHRRGPAVPPGRGGDQRRVDGDRGEARDGEGVREPRQGRRNGADRHRAIVVFRLPPPERLPPEDPRPVRRPVEVRVL